MARSDCRGARPISHHPEGGPPALNIRAAAQFSRQWAKLPTHAKVLHALADAAGLVVTHTDSPHIPASIREDFPDRWLWGGDEATFRACGLFKPSTNWHFQQWGRTTTGEGLDVSLLRLPAHGGEGDSIVAIHDGFGPIGSRSMGRFAALAEADSAFQAFRARVLDPIPGLDATYDPEEWRGPVVVELPASVVREYKRANLFRPVVKAASRDGGRVSVSEHIAETMILDALHWAGSYSDPKKRGAWLQFADDVGKAMRKGADHA